MKRLSTLPKLGMFALVGAALASGVVALSSTPAAAGPPRPDCGPTFVWVCERPGCPDCYVTQFIGTVCEVSQYEERTGRKCYLETY